MKRLSILPIMALLLAVVFSAFTSQTQQAKGNELLWYYTESDNSGADVATNYVPLDGQDGLCSGSPGVVCVIDEPEDGETGFPLIEGEPNVVSFKP